MASSIRYLQKPTTLYFITVDKHPTYWASENGVLIHNGVVGATIGAYTGKWSVYIIGHGSIIAASLASGWGAPATFASLELSMAAEIEVASNVAAVAGGIIGGAATGPI